MINQKIPLANLGDRDNKLLLQVMALPSLQKREEKRKKRKK